MKKRDTESVIEIYNQCKRERERTDGHSPILYTNVVKVLV